MKKSFLLITCFFIAVFSSWSQSAIKGSIKDEAGKAVFSATVSLLQASDSATVKFALSDKEGRYYFSAIREGKYFISASSVGYDTANSSMFAFDKELVEIPSLILLHNKKVLDNVTVTASRPFIEMQLDKMVINVEASPTNAGSNILEVLAKSPAISVDMDENISLNGKQGVMILIDGKTTYLSGKDLAALLKSMPASNTDQIEIMTNPPAKYEAEGMAGVINIKTKKSKKDGWNGSFSTNAGIGIFSINGNSRTTFNSQNNLNFNYKKGKINLFGSGGFSRFGGTAFASFDKTYYTPAYTINGYSFFSFNGSYKGNYVPLSIGLDYYINKKNTVGIVVNKGFSSGQDPRDRTTDLWDENNQLLKHYLSFTNPNYKFNRTTLNLNWKHSMDTLGQEISFDADYVHYGNPYKDTLRTDYYTNQIISQTSFLSNNNQTNTDIFAFKSDYTKPFKDGRFEAGVKFSLVQTDLDNLFYRYGNNQWASDINLSNHSSYKENINAAYININKKLKKWSLQAGLRLENMNMNANQSLGAYKIDRTNTGLFPSFFVGYDLNKNNTMKFSASRRINRYSFYSIMPYKQVVDSLDTWHGNPELKPEHSNRLELAYAFKNKYFFTFSYTITHDAIRYVAAQVGEQKITEFYPVNVDKLNSLNLNIVTPIKIVKWWDINLFTNIYNNKYFNLQNNTVSKFYLTLNENMTNTFNLGKGLKGELILEYNTKSVDQLGETHARFSNISIGLQKQVMKEKGSFTLNITDPFQWCNRYKSIGTYLRMKESDYFYFTSRGIRLTFNYRFGKVSNQGRQHTIASQEEQGR